MMIIRWLYLVVLVLFSLLPYAQATDYGNIKLTGLTGPATVTLGSLGNDKPTYIKLWATWCQPCMQQMPHFEQLHKEFGDKVNFVAVNININENRSRIDEVIQRFKLSMPVLLDNDGQLGVALGLVGTPYSVLINTDGKVVYTTHESDDNLDRFLSMLAQGQKLQSAATDAISDEQKQALVNPWLQGEHLLFFTATWCDWYLLDTRPDMAQQCKRAQSELNELSGRLPGKGWHGFVNHLWTDEQALAEFNTLYKMKVSFSIDTAGVLFNQFNIRSIPTLIHIKDGKILARITAFDDKDSVLKQLSAE